MRWPLRGVVAMLAVAFVASGAGAGGSVPNVRGTVARTFVKAPICTGDMPCDPPFAAGSFILFSKKGRVAARVAVGARGTFALRLPPGLYTVRLLPAPQEGTVAPVALRVPAHGVVRPAFRVRSAVG